MIAETLCTYTMRNFRKRWSPGPRLGTLRRLLGAGEGVEGLLDQVGQVGGSVVLDPGQHGGACGGQAGRHGDPGLEAGVWVAGVYFEGLEDDLLGSDLACPHAFAERGGGDDELDLRQQGVS